MRTALLALALILVLAPWARAPGYSSHLLIGLMPDVIFEVRIDGVKVPGLEPESDRLGIVWFTLSNVEPGGHTIKVSRLEEYELSVGSCWMGPLD